MATTHVFPQDGDDPDSANFGQLIGHSTLTDFVGRGLSVSADFANNSANVSEGVAYIQLSSDTTNGGETRLQRGYVVQYGGGSVTLTDGTVNYIYLYPNVDVNDSAYIDVNTDDTPSSSSALKLADVDTAANSVTEVNRKPSIEAASISADDVSLGSVSSDDSTTTVASSLSVDGDTTVGGAIESTGGTTIFNVSNEYIPLSALEHDSISITTSGAATGGGSLTLGDTLSIDVAQGAGSGLDADTLDGTQLANIDWADLALAQSDISFSDVGKAQSVVDINDNELRNATITSANSAEILGTTTVSGDITDDAGATIFDHSAGHVPQSQIQQGSGSGLDADTLDGTQLANIDWADVALAQSDVSQADVGPADAVIDANGNDIQDDTTTIWDTSAGYIPQGRLQNEAITVTAGTQLTGGGSVSLGGSVTVDLDQGSGSGLDADTLDSVELANIDWADVALAQSDVTLADVGAADTSFDVNGNDIEDGTTTIWDASAGYIPQNRLQDDSVTVSAGTQLSGGGSVALGGSVTIDVDDGPSSGLDADTLDGIQLADIDWSDLALAQSDVTLSDVGAADTAFNTNGYDITDDTTTIWDTSNAHIPQGRLQNDSVTVSTGTQITGGGAVALGGSITVGLDQGAGSGLDADTLDGVQLANIDWGDLALTQSDVTLSDVGAADRSLDMNTNDIVDGTTTIWDTSAGYIPQGRLQNDSVTVSTGTQLTGGGTIALGESITIDLDQGSGSELDADTLDGVQLANITWSDLALSRSDISASDLGFDTATQSELNTHVTDTTNPHSVSVSQLDTYSTADADGRFINESGGDTISGDLTVNGTLDVGGGISHPVYATVSDIPASEEIEGNQVFVQELGTTVVYG
jgi:hypothetical protein